MRDPRSMPLRRYERGENVQNDIRKVVGIKQSLLPQPRTSSAIWPKCAFILGQVPNFRGIPSIPGTQRSG